MQRCLLVHEAIHSGDIEITAWMMEQGQFALDDMYASSLRVDAVCTHCASQMQFHIQAFSCAVFQDPMVASFSTLPWLVKEYGAHSGWTDVHLFPNPTVSAREGYCRYTMGPRVTW